MEHWKPIPGFERYEVSDLGRVRRGARQINPVPDAKGRLVFNVSDANAKRKQLKVSVAVMAAFKGPRPPGHIVAHFPNREQADCRPSNLIYATWQENMDHKVIHGTQPMGTQIYNAKLDDEGVRWVRRNRGKLSQRAMAQRLGVALMTINHVIHRRTWKHL